LTNFLQHKINQRIQSNSLRTLKTQSAFYDFSSNDYLGFAKSDYLKENFESFISQNPSYQLGSTGSRLISGNNAFTEELEIAIANFHKAEAGLIFNSGYDANIGLLSSIALRGDTIITDELIHASIIDGARLSLANKYIFKHNDLNSLEEKLKNSKGNIFVVTESVFSMDGDFAPIKEINQLAKKYNANLIIDEAHATGVFGNFGAGIVNELGLENEIFARVHTFGKALGCHGAIILGSIDLRTYLINFARSFIYTTALPFHSLLSIKLAYQYLKISPEIAQLKSNIALFKTSAKKLKIPLIASESAIQCIIIEGNEQCKKSAHQLQKKGFEVKAILSPTVAEGKERLRICIHAAHTSSEINLLIQELSRL
jgi:8-amino-7-oxononanoate synthase